MAYVVLNSFFVLNITYVYSDYFRMNILFFKNILSLYFRKNTRYTC